MQRVVHSRVAPDCGGCAAGCAFAELHRDADGGLGIPGGKVPERHDREQQGQVHCAGGGRGADGRGRRLLHDRRQDRGIDSADGGQGCGGGGGVGQLRVQRLRAGRQAESDRRDADPQAGGQAGDQCARMPADRRRDDGRGDPPAGAGARFRRSTARAGPRSSTDAAFTTPAIAGPTTMRACLSRRGTTRTRARDIAFTRWAARGR